MKNLLKYSLLALVLAVGAGKFAHATPDHGFNPPPNAPEVDPGMAIGALTLLAGSITVLRSKRR